MQTQQSFITHPFVFLDNWLEDSDLDLLNSYCIKGGVDDATIVGNKGDLSLDNSIRKSKFKLHLVTDENRHFFEKIRDAAVLINSKSYNYDLLGFDYMQYAEYHGTENNFYNFHTDLILGDNLPKGALYPRKLSLSIVLSDPSEYEGGDLEFMWGSKEILKVEQPKGRMIAFPSWLMHRVTPVTSGVRRSIVVWCIGPMFK
jgi:PKHD-type hydroxylase